MAPRQSPSRSRRRPANPGKPTSTPARPILRGRPFAKGQSGNPSGRPALAAVVDRVCDGKPERILEAYAVLAFGGAERRKACFGEPVTIGTKERLRAIDALADRRWGRPAISGRAPSATCVTARCERT